MKNYLVSWVASKTCYVANGVDIPYSHGAMIIIAHSEQEAEGAVLRVVQKKFPSRNIGIGSSPLPEPESYDTIQPFD